MTILDPLAASSRIAESYRGYLSSTFSPRRDDLRRDFDEALATPHRLTKGPFLQASAPFEMGASMAALIDEGVVSSRFATIGDDSFPIDRPLYRHQEEAIRKAVDGRNLVVATGTGSGKTECFLLPIVNHLLREQEVGTLAKPGVRALLLYPMNALANDQVKRLRRLLVNLPEITFGRYVGETETTLAKAEQAFRNRYPSEPRRKNELIAREEMQARPPHILLTNYAMLEYLLLRPDDTALFDGDHADSWRFIVLDEAHVYGGAQGTEIAMLLRRVRDRVVTSEPGRLQCFATSATLGSGVADYPDLIDFAEDLFGEPFAYDPGDAARQDIVSATRRPLVQADGDLDFPPSTFVALQHAFRSGATASELATIVVEACPDAPDATGIEEPAAYLASVLHREHHVIGVQRRLESRSAELRAIAGEVFGDPDAEADMVALIDLCVAARARPDDAPLIPARYHFFIRSLESAFVCQHPEHPAGEPQLRLARSQVCRPCADRGIDAKTFEIGICRSCRAEYLVGQFATHGQGRLFDLAPDFAPERKYLLLGDAVDADDEDQAAAGADEAADTDQQLLCPGCGLVGDGKGRCDCRVAPQPIRVTVVHPSKDATLLRTCASCSTRTSGEVVFRFVTGTDAPVSVIATDLYQAIPPSDDPDLQDMVGQGRKLLAFSDSRQDAAFFAPYLERTYRRSVERRLIADAISELAQRGEYPRTEDVITQVRRRAEDALVIDPDNGRLRNENEVGAWVAQELLAMDRRQSIEGTGLAEIAVAFPRRYAPPDALLRLGFAEAEVADLLQLLFETLRSGAAVIVPEGVDVRDDRFAPRNREFALREEGSETGVISWLPGSASNRRLEIVTKVLDKKGIDVAPRDVLRGLWRYLTDDPEKRWKDVLVASSDSRKGVLWQLASKRLEFIPLSAEHAPFRCGTCQRLWWRNVADVCPGWRCPGALQPVTDLDALVDSHYAELYRRLLPIGVEVQEHTAQWTSAKASSIQDEFIEGRVNVLSCSTTFELGVDVGEVQAVLLRNVPPTPANYVQRAGRAGRRTDSAALVVTFAQRRSHDLTHFDDPRRMVDGTVDPPRILLENPSIVRRHAHSVAFALFERVRAADGEAHRNVEDFFVGAADSESADLRFVDWLRGHPSAVGEALGRILPSGVAKVIGLDTWAWVDALVESSDEDPTFGWLARAGDQVRDDLDTMEQLYQEAKDDDNPARMSNYLRVKKTLSSRPLLAALATANVLPKYGFPVDVVELNLARSGDEYAKSLDLSRDLKMAIREYAPGGQVVAAKMLWESTGLGVRAGHSWPTYKWAICQDCGSFRQHLKDLEACAVCGSSSIEPGRAGQYVIPMFGFTGKRLDKPGENRPLRQSVTETYFGAYRDEVLELEPVVELSDAVPVLARTSRQGQIYVINRGPAGRGFRFCDRCGHGEPAPVSRGKRRSTEPKPHPDDRRPGRDCNGLLLSRHLGHQFLTDVTEVRVGVPMTDAEANSVLFALVEGAEKLGISRDDIDGTLYQFSKDEPPAMAIFDSVPGGAGYAQRIADDLPALFRAALARVATCECEPETSCYTCLRSYGNQMVHDVLSRGAAADILRKVLAASSSVVPVPGSFTNLPSSVQRELDLMDAELAVLVRRLVERGAPVPVAGYELDTDDGWMVEAAWPEQQVAALVDAIPDRDGWLIAEGWTIVRSGDWDESSLLQRLRA